MKTETTERIERKVQTIFETLLFLLFFEAIDGLLAFTVFAGDTALFLFELAFGLTLLLFFTVTGSCGGDGTSCKSCASIQRRVVLLLLFFLVFVVEGPVILLLGVLGAVSR